MTWRYTNHFKKLRAGRRGGQKAYKLFLPPPSTLRGQKRGHVLQDTVPLAAWPCADVNYGVRMSLAPTSSHHHHARADYPSYSAAPSLYSAAPAPAPPATPPTHSHPATPSLSNCTATAIESESAPRGAMIWTPSGSPSLSERPARPEGLGVSAWVVRSGVWG